MEPIQSEGLATYSNLKLVIDMNQLSVPMKQHPTPFLERSNLATRHQTLDIIL